MDFKTAIEAFFRKHDNQAFTSREIAGYFKIDRSKASKIVNNLSDGWNRVDVVGVKVYPRGSSARLYRYRRR